MAKEHCLKSGSLGAALNRWIALTLAIGMPCRSVAQHPDSPLVVSRALSGFVTDGAGHPVAGALVVVDGGYTRATTDSKGYFHLATNPALHQVVVTRIGFKPDSLLVDVRSQVPAATDQSTSPRNTIDIVLIRSEQQLRAVTVEGVPAPFLAQTVTAATVSNIPALAEPDIFRAVSLLPGVSTPNDTRGRLHLAGGASDEVGIRLDGHPLQDPFHLFGLLGAFNVAALERADILIHALPPGMSDHLSGVIDLETRRPTSETTRDLSVSVLATSATIGTEVVPGLDVLAAARITYFDKLIPLFSRNAKIGGDEVPLYGFRDGLLRVGHSSRNWRLEQVSFFTSDVLPRTGTRDAAGYVPYNWGEYLIGLRAETFGKRWNLSSRVSTGRYNVEVDERVLRGNYLSNRYSRQSAAVELATHARNWEFTTGVSADVRRNRQDWDYRAMPEGPSPNAPLTYKADARQQLIAYYGDIATFIGGVPDASSPHRKKIRVHAGARLMTTGSENGASPSVGIEYEASSTSVLGLSAERRYQFQGIIEEPGSLTIRPVEILLKTPRIADVGGISWAVRRVVLPVSSFGSFRLEGFAKRYRNQVRVLGRRYGELDQDYALRFPELEAVPGTAVGALLNASLEVGARARIQGSYTLQRVRQTFDAETAPTSWDIPQQLSTFASLDLTTRWTIDVVFQAHTGVPMTPVAARVLVPIDAGVGFPGFADGPRNSLRAPAYQRLDVSAQRRWTTRSGKEWTLSFHILNALARANPTSIDWDQYYSQLANQARGGAPPDPRETMLPSLPLLPSVGVRLKW